MASDEVEHVVGVAGDVESQGVWSYEVPESLGSHVLVGCSGEEVLSMNSFTLFRVDVFGGCTKNLEIIYHVCFKGKNGYRCEIRR